MLMLTRNFPSPPSKGWLLGCFSSVNGQGTAVSRRQTRAPGARTTNVVTTKRIKTPTRTTLYSDGKSILR